MTLSSRALGEERSVRIDLPPGYKRGEAYPLVLVMTTEMRASEGPMPGSGLAAAIIQAGQNVWQPLPPMIVVEVPTTDPARDHLAVADPARPGSGHVSPFLDFLVWELIPRLETKLGTDGPRILVGEQTGGAAVLAAALTEPEMFDAFLAIAPDLSATLAAFDAHASPTSTASEAAWLWMATVDGLETEDRARLKAAIDRQALGTIENLPGATAVNAMPTALPRGLSAVFEGTNQGRDVALFLARGGSVAAWFQQEENRLGYRFHPQSYALMQQAHAFGNAGEIAAALDLIVILETRFPNNPWLAEAEGDIAAAAGDTSRAARAFERAESLARSLSYVPSAITQLERKVEATAPAAP
ncbi:MAG: alpha/beta hydrolase-fold protein [Pseudomonadota bacterium]